jgi:hypothetical protein
MKEILLIPCTAIDLAFYLFLIKVTSKLLY